jgi:hypothetical protein
VEGLSKQVVLWCNGSKADCCCCGLLLWQVCEDDQKLSVTYNIVSSDDFETDLTFNSLCTASPFNNGEVSKPAQHNMQLAADSA